MNYARLLTVLVGLGACLALVLLDAFSPRTAHSQPQGPTYSLIVEGVYQGGNTREPPRGTKAVLNLCEHKDPYTCQVHVWDPIKDAKAPSLAWLREKVEFVERHRKEGRTVYVHCRNGASRSALVVIAYVMYTQKLPRDKAVEFVRSRRKETRPSPALIDLLDVWERELSAPPKRQRSAARTSSVTHQSPASLRGSHGRPE